MRVFVTGANGFIGTALCQHLANRGACVHGLVRADLPDEVGVVYHSGALEDRALLLSCLVGVDCLVHLAGRAHVMREGGESLTAFRAVNRDATLSLARIAQEAGVKRFVFVSSIGVNGAETFAKPFDEYSEPEPHADYALSKLEAEQGLKSLLAGSGTELVIIRPPLVYGIDAPGNFARLLKLVATGLPLPLRGVDNRRSIISLENLVGFISLCIEHPAAAEQLFLVSDGKDISTAEMVRALALGMDKRPLMLPAPDALLKLGARLLGKESIYTQLYRSLQVESSKARRLLGWQPEENTLEALEKVGRLYISQR
ncbi:NAD-dependent epimerase/dehydratase family protein [Pseudomonas sp. EA_105y_Pfl2_R69]|uniref:NAD-dependent epimerase/dehydratase family protein n=1 Tax=Pseudomonas sp. EA_105y_Pfl2_R69 TaxID=3088683 RepID=UPI0030DA369E